MKNLKITELFRTGRLDGRATAKVQDSGDRKVIYVEDAAGDDLPCFDRERECITIWQSGRYKISVS